MSMQVLQDAVIRLLRERPFYGYLLCGLRRRITAGGGAVGITVANGIPTLCCDPRDFAALTESEQEALLEHALKHLLHLHPLRRKDHHPLLWDVACDLAINPTIIGLPGGAVHPARYHLPSGLAAEEYYQSLRRPFDTGNLAGDGYGTADAFDSGAQRQGEEADREFETACQRPIDNHQVWHDAQGTPLRLAETAIRTLVGEAWRRSGGEIPGEMRSLVESWLRPAPTPWPEILRQFVATAGRIGRTATWNRAHRRFHFQTPGQRRRRRLNLLIGIDVSDSTDQRPLREAFARELLRISAGRQSCVTVLYAGSCLQKIQTFNGHPGVVEVYEGGGFTDLRPVFAYARQMRPRPAAVIYLTDGYGPAPERQEFPTLWVLPPDGVRPAPWGVELRLAT